MRRITLLSARLSWLNLPTLSLLALLQRTPLAPFAAVAERFVLQSPIATVLKSAFAVSASLGAVHSLAGATTFATSPASPLTVDAGKPIATVGMRVSGAPKIPRSYTISGAMPPGLSITGSTVVSSDMKLPAVLNVTSSTGAISLTGTPTKAGTYDMGIKAWENANASGLSSIVYTYRVVVSASDTALDITTQPKSQTVAVGKNVTFTVVASGSPEPTYQWKKGSTSLSGKTSATLTLSGVAVADAGVYTCVVTNSAKSVTSAKATLAVKEKPATPVAFGAYAAGTTAVALSWQPATSTSASAPTGYRIERATNSAFTSGKKTINVKAVTSYVDKSVVAKKTYYYRLSAVTVAGASGRTTSVKVVTLSSVAKTGARALSFVNRVYCGTGSSVTTGGFLIGAGAPKAVLIRAVGPTLSTQGVSSSAVLKNPVLEVFVGETLVATNDDWATNANVSTIQTTIAAVGALPFRSTDKTSSALLVTLPPGSYTFKVTGRKSTKGIVQVEIHDAD